MIGKLFRLISLTKQRKNTIPSKFPVFRGEVQKVFWNTTLFCRQWFRLLSALIFKSFFQKQQSVGNTNVFLWTSSQKIGRKYDSYLGKKSCQLWQKSKAFSFPSKANTVRDKKTSCVTSTSKTVWKTFLKHQSLSVSQKASSLHTRFTPACITTPAYIKIYSSKTMLHL